MIVYVQIELLDTVALNLHRIDKDVARCDRNYFYFTSTNLEKLRNIMCRSDKHLFTNSLYFLKFPLLIDFMYVFCLSYVWEHLEVGYVQGMCDLLAPLMVILDDGKNLIHQLGSNKYFLHLLRFFF